MAKAQSQICIICETLLSADSDESSSLQGLNTDGLIEGNSAYVVEEGRTYKLAPASTLTPDNDAVVAAAGGGNWLLVSGGDDPVVVRTLDDLPAPDTGVITLADTVMYLFEGEIDLGANRIVAGAGSGIQGGAGALLYGTNSNAIITGPTGGDFRLNNIAVQNLGTGAAVIWTGDGDGSQFWIHDVSLAGRPGLALVGGGDGDTGDYVYVYDSRFYSRTADYHAVEVGLSWSAVSFIGCRFLGAGDGLKITSADNAIDNMMINGCEFHPLTGKTGIIQDVAGAVEAGRLVGNNFWGAGTFKNANVVTTDWAGVGNTGVADF